MLLNRSPKMPSISLTLLFFCGVCFITQGQAPPARKTRSVLLIVLDGLRWQEVFRGADPVLMNSKNGGVQDVEALRKQFWRETLETRREALLPFLWGVVAKQGQLYGNQEKKSIARVTNGFKFSYPGYNEMLTGRADPRIDKNDYGPNLNMTVFEWLNQNPEFHDRVAAFANWNAFNDIFNVQRSGLLVRAGWDLPWPEPLSPRAALMKKLYATTTRIDEEGVPDSYMHEDLLDYLSEHHPRVLFVGYGETDDWAHDGRYDLVLESAHEADAHISELWNLMQGQVEYRGQVTFIITTDHGRGSGLKDWKHHGKKITGAENIWIGVIGPDTPAQREMANVPEVTQSQIAATVAALVGQDYRAAVPGAAPPFPVF
jgi:hypothetical protein